MGDDRIYAAQKWESEKRQIINMYSKLSKYQQKAIKHCMKAMAKRADRPECDDTSIPSDNDLQQHDDGVDWLCATDRPDEVPLAPPQSLLDPDVLVDLRMQAMRLRNCGPAVPLTADDKVLLLDVEAALYALERRIRQRE